jgi:hypothetical protein
MRKKPIVGLFSIVLTSLVLGVAIQANVASVASPAVEVPLGVITESPVEEKAPPPRENDVIVVDSTDTPAADTDFEVVIDIDLVGDGKYVISWIFPPRQEAKLVEWSIVVWDSWNRVYVDLVDSSQVIDNIAEGSIEVEIPAPTGVEADSDDNYKYTISVVVTNGGPHPKERTDLIPASFFEPPAPSIDDLVADLVDCVMASADDAWKKPGDNRKRVIVKKLTEVLEKVGEGDIEGAINKISKDILPKVTGKWVADETLQDDCAAILATILDVLIAL